MFAFYKSRKIDVAINTKSHYYRAFTHHLNVTGAARPNRRTRRGKSRAIRSSTSFGDKSGPWKEKVIIRSIKRWILFGCLVLNISFSSTIVFELTVFINREKLCISALPQQEIRQTEFSAGA